MKRTKNYWPVGHSDQTFFDAKKGDEKAKKVVIEAFTPMVHMWAHNYIYLCPRYLYEDLVQEGILGILKAIYTYREDIKRDDGKAIKPSTWIWWKVRAQVQGAANKLGRHYKNSVSSLPKEEEVNLEELEVFSYKESDLPTIDIEKLIIDGCGSLNCKRANIIKDKFGLLGATQLKHKEAARKNGVTKQTANAQFLKFSNIVKKKYPELKEMIP